MGQLISDLAENVGIIANALSFSTSFLHVVDLRDGSLVVNPENNPAGGSQEIGVGTEMI